MRDIDVTYYTIQHRTTHESPYGKPEGRLKRVKDKEWSCSSWDYFDQAFRPHFWRKNAYLPRWRLAGKDYEKLWQETGRRGWRKLKHAIRALNEARRLDDAGEFDSRDTYNKKTQAVRHEFRIICVRYLYQAWEVILRTPVGKPVRPSSQS